ncbi:engulfment and cell motility protein 2-like isoform X2 [Lethenteron reissneri]|uniref:engulfment and cell motility protein 2-like isoform X2 n=1 Tax=Lethenteron reissneri TaxID=7753 RepID=UPI002AB61D62|nr:engulfment and cell motility protein 2-like isoform X2 [Lethenteron reissneri]
MPPPQDVVKVAIQYLDQFPLFIEIDQKKPLSAIVQEVCETWKLPDPAQFTLQYGDGTEFYITEKNRNDVKNGAILKLAVSQERMARELHEKLLSTSMEAKLEAVKSLAKLAADPSFAREFIARDGIAALTQMVDVDLGELLAFTLTAFLELMDHGIISWDNLTVSFVKKIASYVRAPNLDATLLQRSLAILECMVLNSLNLYSVVSQEITVGQLINHLQVSNQEIQTNAVALLNALLLKAPEETKQLDWMLEMSEEDPGRVLTAPLTELANSPCQKQLRTVILNSVIRGQHIVGTEMAHQLYVLQVLSLNLLEERMMTKMDPQDQAQRDTLFELCRIAFDAEAEAASAPGGTLDRRKGVYSKDYKKLGFTNHVNPALDFMQTPPGMLALDNMIYFAKHHTDPYVRLVLENSCRDDKHECPFGRSSIELTGMLCETLHVGEPPTETGQDFCPMFFTHDRAMEEMFCVCIQLLNKTWKEMRATSEDFGKVMQVVREQIVRALVARPKSLDQFRNKLQSLSYTEILKIRQTERMSQEEGDSHTAPIVELREKLQPEILDLIRKQRLNRLCEGTLFRKISSRRRQDKYWYCRLSQNHKVLHYGDVEEGTGVPSIEALQEKLAIVDVKAVVTGKDCPHLKDKSTQRQNKEMQDLAFSILHDPDEALNFIAPNKYEYCVWTDGLSALLGKEMGSEYTRTDLEMLLSMEIKLQLLDLESIPIPETAPPLPKEPSNFDFAYDYS